MLTLEQAKHIIELTNAYVEMSLKWRELECTFEEYEASKHAMSKYLASLVPQ